MPENPANAITQVQFGALNTAIFVIYMVSMVVIGWRLRGRIKGTRGFFIAEGKLHYALVGLSLLATYLSALTMMALPRTSFGQDDFIWTVQLPCLILTGFVITRFVLKRLRDANVISVYEFLEQRIHLSVRLMASATFVVLSIGRMALNLFLPALALYTITGINLPFLIVCTGVVVIVYCYIGGMEAVIWTDAVMAVVFAIGAILSVGVIFANVSPGQFMSIAMEHHKFRTFDWSLDWTKKATVWFLLSTVVETIRIYGTQQDMTQRYMTTKSTAQANRSVWMAILGYIPLGLIFYFMGVALFVFYKMYPDPSVPALVDRGQGDAIYPWFIMTHLPAGLSGFMIVAIFAASMSTISGSLNSSATVLLEDFYKRLIAPSKSDRHYLVLAQVLTVALGVLSVLAGLGFIGHVKQAQDTWNQVMAISTCGVLGLMLLAFLPFRVNKWAVLVGFFCSYASLSVMMFHTKVIFLLWPVVTNSVCFFVSLGVNAVISASRRSAT